jgi:RHS repeat-associated protein
VQDRRGHLLGVATEDKLHLIEEKAGSYGPLVPIDLHSFLSYAKTLLWQGLGADPTGLVRLGDRYLDPRTGRFLTPDPLGYPLSLDLYTYAYGDPINFLDPDGWCAFAAYEKIRSSAIDLWHSPRFHGALQTFAGCAEVSLGGGMTYATGGLIAPVGWAMMAHGLDHLITGMKTIINGRQKETATSQLLQNTGMNPEQAAFLDQNLNLFATMGGGGLVYHTAQKAALLNPTLLSTSKSFMANRPATSSISAYLLKNKLIAEEIASGHAFTKHVVQGNEFFGFSQLKFEKHLRNILDNTTEAKS